MNYEYHYKDSTPTKTLKKIKGILSDLNIEVQEIWFPKSSINTYSLRLQFKNAPLYGVNGKGITKDLALASAYGELIERLENSAIGELSNLANEEFSYKYFYDEKDLSVEDLLNENSSFVKYLIKKINSREINKEIGSLYCSKMEQGEKFISIPYFDITNEKTEYLPLKIIRSLYGTNGMASGNTEYEALVQSISEILERYTIRYAIENKITFPNIPEKYLRKYDDLYRMYLKIKNNKKYDCYIKDASLGGLFPVVALIIIEKNTGNYGVKFGSHPVFKIALERTLTEATQAQDIFEFSKESSLNFNDEGLNKKSNLMNIFEISKGRYPIEFFGLNPTYEFKPKESLSDKTNKELFFILKELLEDKGYSILVRNSSFLGFPSFHVIIPGLSETEPFSKSELRYENTYAVVSNMMQTPSQLIETDLNYIIPTLRHYTMEYTKNNLEILYSRKDGFEYPFRRSGLDQIYFILLGLIVKKEFDSAIKICKFMLKSPNISEREKEYLNCLFHYVTGKK